MHNDRLNSLVRQIRAAALSDIIIVLRDNNRATWKNQLLHYLSDNVVRNHLMCLHPYQYFDSNKGAGLYSFKVNLYSENIYLKVNVNTWTVVSFHYDELPSSAWIPAHLSTGTEIALNMQVLAEPFKAGGYQASFAIGSGIAIAQIYPNFKDGLAYIDSGQYNDAVSEMAKTHQRSILRKLEYFDRDSIKKLLGPTDDYSILSYTDGQLQVINLCCNLFRKHSDEKWIQDMAIDLLMKQDAALWEKYMRQLHPDSKEGFTSKFELLAQAGLTDSVD